jgi:DNA polymerase
MAGKTGMGKPEAAEWLRWYAEMGADEAISDTAIDRFAESDEAKPAQAAERQPQPGAAARPSGSRTPLRPPPAPPPAPPRQPDIAPEAVPEEIEAMARNCQTLDEVARALDGFDACPLKRTATRLCFADGLPGAHLMVVGEAPGREEDEQGLPFVGRSGQLLDKMLAAIGLDRHSEDPASSVFISNIVFWRPPGNRKPSASEVMMCLPFVRRTIELASPKVVMAAGGTPAQALLDTTTGITRLRGTWKDLRIGDKTFPFMPTFHPSYLLRSPEARRLAWADLVAVKARLLAE